MDYLNIVISIMQIIIYFKNVYSYESEKLDRIIIGTTFF